jgi:hypothetical protein
VLCAAHSQERLCWRPWPCPECNKSTTPIGFLIDRHNASSDVRTDVVEYQIEQEIKWLSEFVAHCEHTKEEHILLPKISEGSEHLVFFDADKSQVYKLTKPNLFGEAYYLDSSGRINQRNCGPMEYLIRLRIWKKIFGSAPFPLGITNSGQIVSAHQFISGSFPTQGDVDNFLVTAGLIPVKQEYWLWKKSYPAQEFDIGLGDARADNFVSSASGIVPIDIRLWFSPLSA